MKSVDKFLFAVVGAVLVLVVIAFAVILRRPPPAFKSEDTTAGVAHNYLLALQQKDYARAYTYLSPSLKGYPKSMEQFVRDIRNYSYSFPLDDNSITLEIESTSPIAIGTEAEQVSVRETRFYQGGIFGSNQYSNVFDMDLQREGGAWKIITSERYFARCWSDTAGCK